MDIFLYFYVKNVDILKLKLASELYNFWLNKVVFGSNQRVKIVIFNNGNLDWCENGLLIMFKIV